MAVKVRLKRIGKNPKGRIHFRIAAMDEHRGRDSRVLEELGYYNPITEAISIKKEKLDYWLRQGAQLTTAVENLLKKINKKKSA